MHRICFPLFAAAIAFSTFAAGQVSAQTPASSTPPPTVYVKAGHLFDSTSDNLRENVVLVVEGERITKVAAAGDVDGDGEQEDDERPDGPAEVETAGVKDAENGFAGDPEAGGRHDEGFDAGGEAF